MPANEEFKCECQPFEVLVYLREPIRGYDVLQLPVPPCSYESFVEYMYQAMANPEGLFMLNDLTQAPAVSQRFIPVSNILSIVISHENVDQIGAQHEDGDGTNGVVPPGTVIKLH